MAIDASWLSGSRQFSCDEEVHTLRLSRDWQGRWKRAVVLDDRGAVVGSIDSRAGLITGRKIELGHDHVLRIVVRAGFQADALEVRLDGAEPRWLAPEPLTLDALGSLIAAQGPRNLIYGLVGGLVGGVLLAAGLSTDYGLQGFVALLVGALLLYAGVAGLREGIDFLRGKRSRFGALLASTPQKIGWVHGEMSRTGGLSMVVHLVDGDTKTFALKPVDFDPAIELFRERAPHAAFGFTDEARQQYEQRSGKKRPRKR